MILHSIVRTMAILAITLVHVTGSAQSEETSTALNKSKHHERKTWFSPDGKYSLTNLNYDDVPNIEFCRLYLWDASTSEVIGQYDYNCHWANSPPEIEWSRDSRFLALSIATGRKQWDTVMFLVTQNSFQEVPYPVPKSMRMEQAYAGGFPGDINGGISFDGWVNQSAARFANTGKLDFSHTDEHDVPVGRFKTEFVVRFRADRDSTPSAQLVLATEDYICENEYDITLYEHLTEADRELNESYKDAMKRAPTAEARKHLLSAQRAWITYRDAHSSCTLSDGDKQWRSYSRGRQLLNTIEKRTEELNQIF